MDRYDFIITVYCMVCRYTHRLKQQFKIRRGGCAPVLTDEEVMTVEICGEYFKLNTDEEIFDYFQSHYQADFPHLRDRTLFVRQAANLWQVKAARQQLRSSPVVKPMTPSKPLIPCPCPYASSPGLSAIVVSNRTPIMATVRPSQ